MNPNGGETRKRLSTTTSAPAKCGRRGQAAIRRFLDFAYSDRYQLQFDREYDLLPATTSAAAVMAKSPEFSAFLTNIPNSDNYPDKTNWTTVENQIKTTLGQAITGSPAKVLGAIQQTATSSGG